MGILKFVIGILLIALCEIWIFKYSAKRFKDNSQARIGIRLMAVGTAVFIISTLIKLFLLQ